MCAAGTVHAIGKDMNTTQSTKPMVECPKCCGAKRISHFAHIEGGTCFRCGGAGVVTMRSTKKVVKEVALPAVTVATLDRTVEQARRLVANSHRGEVLEYCSYSMGVIQIVGDQLARATADDRATYEPKFRAVLGRNWHLVKIAD